LKTWDAIIIGGGIIGLSLAIALRKRGVSVLVVERGEPGREASYAAAGMIADLEAPVPLRALATASAKMYPEFVHELQDESGVNVDLRSQGTLFVLAPDSIHNFTACDSLTAAQVHEIEPAAGISASTVVRLEQSSVDPRALVAASLLASKHREVDISSGSEVTNLLLVGDRVDGVVTGRTTYPAPLVINCAGAWAGHIHPHQYPARPVKGQMLAVIGGPKINHVIRDDEIYLVPRTDGRIVIGATVEEAGYDKRTDPSTIQSLRKAAIKLVPEIAAARIHEAWAGLRPGTPDGLPLLGATCTPGYFVATGHFRDGILLAPITAQVMAQVVMGDTPEHDLEAFSPERFTNLRATL
jgi:glycine oxidase